MKKTVERLESEAAIKDAELASAKEKMSEKDELLEQKDQEIMILKRQIEELHCQPSSSKDVSSKSLGSEVEILPTSGK